MPAVKMVLAGAEALALGHGKVAAVAAAYRTESIAGGLNLLISFVMAALAVWRPRPGRPA